MPRPSKPSPTALGQLIRERREAAHLSRAKLAKKAHLSAGTLKNIELGRHLPMRTTLAELARALDLPELVTAPAQVMALLRTMGPEDLAELLKRFSVSTLAEAICTARIDVWALMTELCPHTVRLAEMLARLDVRALAAEQRAVPADLSSVPLT